MQAQWVGVKFLENRRAVFSVLEILPLKTATLLGREAYQ